MIFFLLDIEEYRSGFSLDGAHDPKWEIKNLIQFKISKPCHIAQNVMESRERPDNDQKQIKIRSFKWSFYPRENPSWDAQYKAEVCIFQSGFLL